MKKLLFLLFCLTACIAAQATTYYISPTGNDGTGTGSISQPWKTLAKATSTVTTPGDIIHINAGTYLETVQCFLSPGVSIEGEGNTSVIQSTWPWSFQGALVLTSPEGTNGNQHITNIKMDGRNTTPRCLEVYGRSNVSITHCSFVDFKEEGPVISGTIGYTGFAPGTYATGNIFSYNYVSNCSMYAGYGTGCLGIGGQIGMLCVKDTILQPKRAGTDQVGWPLKYFNEGWTQGVLFDSCIFWKDPTASSGWNFSFEWFNCRGTEIKNCHFTGSVDFNFQGTRGAYPYVIYFHDNLVDQVSTSTGRVEQGLIIEYDCDGLWVKHNKFKNIAQVLTFYCRANTLTKGVIFTENLCDSIGYPPDVSQGGFIGGFDAGTSNYRTDSIVIDNNTFIGNPAAKANQGIGFGNVQTGYVKNIFIRNNYIENVVYPAFSTGGTAPRDSFYIGYNNIKSGTTDQYGIGNSDVYLPNGAPTHYTNTHNKHNAPGFVDRINYYLSPTSLLRDSGINVGYGADIGYKQFGSVLNTCPIVNAGPDQTIESPISSTNLAATASDAVGTISTIVVTKKTGTGTVSNSASLTTAITGLVVGTSTYEVAVTDDSGCVRKDTMQITVTSGVAPTVTSTNPANASTGISINLSIITVSVSEPLKASTVNATNCFVSGKSGVVNYTAGNTFFTITFASDFSPSTTYNLNVQNVQDVAGNSIASPFTSTFTTGLPQPDTKKFILKGL